MATPCRVAGWAARRFARLAAWAAAVLTVAACSGALPLATVGPTAALSPAALQAELSALPPGQAAAGQAVFSAVGCVACHSLQPGVRVVGPSLAGVATRAASRRPGYSAPLYLYESITRPRAFVVPGFADGLMPPDFKARLKPQDLSDLIAFLLTEQ